MAVNEIMKKILILNGPNLNLLGLRQQEIYGEMCLEELVYKIKDKYSNHTILHFQSNHEGELIDMIHKHGFSYDGIVLNAGAYAHTSIAIADAVRSVNSAVVEVHISDIKNREDFRKNSYLEDPCVCSINGKGTEGYFEAIDYLLKLA
jgi:3-dehydroquinate dehydratase-2